MQKGGGIDYSRNQVFLSFPMVSSVSNGNKGFSIGMFLLDSNERIPPNYIPIFYVYNLIN